jgi:hypothetical protein
MNDAARPVLRRDRLRGGVRSLPGISWIGLALYVLIALFLLAMMIVLIVAVNKAQGLSPTCGNSHGVMPAWPLLGAALGALVVGRVVGHVRYNETWKKGDPASRRLGRAAWATFALVCTGALTYEAVGVLQGNTLGAPAPQPITSYVRCAIVLNGGGPLSYLVLCSICLLLGQWLWAWHRPEDFADDRS